MGCRQRLDNQWTSDWGGTRELGDGRGQGHALGGGSGGSGAGDRDDNRWRRAPYAMRRPALTRMRNTPPPESGPRIVGQTNASAGDRENNRRRRAPSAMCRPALARMRNRRPPELGPRIDGQPNTSVGDREDNRRRRTPYAMHHPALARARNRPPPESRLRIAGQPNAVRRLHLAKSRGGAVVGMQGCPIFHQEDNCRFVNNPTQAIQLLINKIRARNQSTMSSLGY